MESGRLFFDPNSGCHGGNMLFLGNSDHIFRGQRSIITMDECSKRRPFFSLPDEIYDEEYYDEQLPEKKRRLSPEQVHLLEKSFDTENKLEPDRKTQLAKKLGLQPRQVAVWFQNRRARWKTKQLERDYDILKSSYDSLLAKYDSIHKENEKLKFEMTSLTEKLEAKKDHQEAGAAAAAAPPPPADPAAESAGVKTEDVVSTGSGGGSAVVDVEEGLQLVDSGDSYFQYACEEEDGSDDGQNYFSVSHAFAAAAVVAEHHQHDEGETMGWWVWNN